MKKPRPYSFAFRPNDPTTARSYLVNRIPPKLWIAVRARAKRENISIRQLVLQFLQDWVERPPDTATTTTSDTETTR